MSTASTFKLLAMGDYHCGHRAGLTPPGWDAPETHKAFYGFRRMAWDWYSGILKKIGPVDLALLNGDLVDGPGKKSGGSEHLDTAPEEQVEMALKCAREIQTKEYVLTYGTAYHTGAESDYERNVAEHLGASIEGTQHFKIHGVGFNARHHVGGSTVPYGRATPVSREATWNSLNALVGTEPEARVILRSHVHYHVYAGDMRKLVMTLPCLQGPGSKFGRRCTGTVDMGMILFEISPTGAWNWQQYHLDLSPTCPIPRDYGVPHESE